LISAKRNTTAAALTTLAVIQFSLLANRLETGSAERIAIGDDLSDVRVGQDYGSGGLLNEYQLVLVFDPECVHSRGVAWQWERFLREPDNPDRPARILAVAPGSLEAAARHADANGWEVPVATIDRPRPGSRERALVSRTPWVLALRDGRVVAEGPGHELAEVVAALSPAIGAARGARPQLAAPYLP